MVESLRDGVVFGVEGADPVGGKAGGSPEGFGVFTQSLPGYQPAHAGAGYERMLPAGFGRIMLINVRLEFFDQELQVGIRPWLV